jgi:hypothetical protein
MGQDKVNALWVRAKNREVIVIQAVYLDPKFEKQMRMLRRAGKKAALAADKADSIIAGLRVGESLPEDIGSMTKHGEQRIRGLIKYDLGSGYRLVTYRQGFRIYLLYVGTHDVCHRWIENNRELAIDQVRKRCTKLMVESAEMTSDMAEDAPAALAAEEDYDPLENLSETELRQVFRGLVDAL